MKRSSLLEIHRASGARLQDQADPPFVLTYGDVPAEYAAATERAGLVDETDRGLIRVHGEEARTFLHGLLANEVRGLTPDGGNRNLLLTPKGKVRFDFDLACVGDDEFLISTAAGDAEGLLAALDMYLFAEKVELEDVTERHAPVSVIGPAAADAVRSVCGVAAPDTDHARVAGSVAGDDVTVTRIPVAGSPGYRVDGGPATSERLWNAFAEAGASPFGVVVRDILRVEAGAGLPGFDIDENIYPQEARLEPAFSLDKGCYIGQEVVAKIDTYGGLNKRMVALKVSHDDPIPRGTKLYREEEGGEWRELGVVTSWAYSFVLDTGLVLAYAKRKHQLVGTTFRIGEANASGEIVALPVRPGAVAISAEAEE